MVEVDVGPPQCLKLARTQALTHQDAVGQAVFEEHPGAPHQQRVLGRVEACLRLACAVDLGHPLALDGVPRQVPPRVDRKAEQLAHALRHVSPRRRRQLGGQAAHHPLEVLERHVGQARRADLGVDVVAEERHVLRLVLLPHVVGVGLAQPAARPLLGELLDGGRHGAGNLGRGPRGDVVGGVGRLLEGGRGAGVAGDGEQLAQLLTRGHGAQAPGDVGEQRGARVGFLLLHGELERWAPPSAGRDADADARHTLVVEHFPSSRLAHRAYPLRRSSRGYVEQPSGDASSLAYVHQCSGLPPATGATRGREA
jgi:hypothetical protein